MSKDLIKLIAENSDKLTKMVEQEMPFNEILKQSELLDKYITEFYNKDSNKTGE